MTDWVLRIYKPCFTWHLHKRLNWTFTPQRQNLSTDMKNAFQDVRVERRNTTTPVDEYHEQKSEKMT